MRAINKLFLVLIISAISVGCFAGNVDENYHWIKNIFSQEKLNKPIRSKIGTQQQALNKETVKCLTDENEALNIESQLVHEWAKSWMGKNKDSFMSLLHSEFTSEVLTEKKNQTINGLIQVYNFTATNEKINGSSTFDYIKNFSSIEHIDFDFVSMNLPADLKETLKQNKPVTIIVKADIRGIDQSQLRRNDRFVYQARVLKANNNWKLLNLEMLSGESLRSKSALFREITSESALANLPIYTRTEAIRRGGFALAMADYNNDGFTDMLIGNEGNAQLLIGSKEQKFTLDKGSVINSEKFVKTAIFSDLNNDGWQDLILVRFLKDKENSVNVFHNKNGVFEKTSAQPEKNAPDFAMPAAVADFNADGFLDLYVGFPGVKDFTNLEFSYGAPLKLQKNKVPHGIYLNNQHMGFNKAQGAINAGESYFGSKNKPTFNHQFPHSALAFDYDNDGHQDVIVMDDRGGLSPLFRNKGNGIFEQVADRIGIANYGFGMGVSAADFNNDGLIDIAMTNVDFTAGHRVYNSCLNNHDIRLLKNVSGGMVLFQNIGGGKFADVSNKANVSWVGQGAGSLEFFDYDNDGWQDVYVVNGLWSGTNKYEDLSSYFVRALWADIEWDRPTIDYGRSRFMQILSDYKADKKSDGNYQRISMAGFQRNRLFHNNRDGSFTEIGYLAAVDSIADGYVVAKADLNKDGNMDLVLRNADPGTAEYKFQPVQILSNLGQVKYKSVEIQLVGHKSNRDAIGSQVIAEMNNKEYFYELMSNNGAAQGERIIHVGLGQSQMIDKLTVKWPSGHVSVLKSVKPGFIKIEENTNGFYGDSRN